ncbi:ParB N-terminal domain-containing protein [Nostoc sp.]|uniref:ParB N-terminal domain-containing protein n=1 Tax=Nostoc sp. TaxID=1180 RepID=UPI002FF07D23
MTKFLMVDVESVNSNVPRSEFSESDLNMIADMILNSGGIVKPLVLKKTGFEKYEVVNGHFEYHAAVRASEKNSIAGEMVNALVISPEKEEAILKQAAALRGVELSNQPINTITSTTNLESSRIANLELRLEKQLNDFRSEFAQERERVEDKLNKIQSQIPKKITPLDVFNTLSLSELILRLVNAGFSNQTATKVTESVEKERNKKPFVSLNDVVIRVKITSGKRQVKGITSDKMIAIIDSWSRTLFI